MTESQAEIYDLGYQGYDGPRGGRAYAIRSLWINGARTTLGLGRGAMAKILPALLLIATVGPALGLIAAAALFGAGGEIEPADPAEYFSNLAFFLFILAAAMAPELLIPDRRSGVINLYLVRPLTSVDYVAARWGALFSVALAFALAAMIATYAGNLLAADTPVDYLRDNWGFFPQAIAASVLLAGFLATIPLAVSAFTSRRAYAIALSIALIVVGTTVSAILTAEQCNCGSDALQEAPAASARPPDSAAPSGSNSESGQVTVTFESGRRFEELHCDCGPLTGDFARYAALLDFAAAPTDAVAALFDSKTLNAERDEILDDLPTWAPVAWYALLIAASGALLVIRYRRMTI